MKKDSKSPFCYTTLPVLQMRELPSISSKVVSEALFGESLCIEMERQDWTYIVTSDEYKGWVESKSLLKREGLYAPLVSESLKISRPAAHVYSVKDTEYGPLVTLPYGVFLQKDDECDSRWLRVALPDGRKGYIQRGDVVLEELIRDPIQLIEFSKKFLGSPYTWGGRSSFGFDCSGFVQTVYRQIGVNLPRDSHQQIQDQQLSPRPWEELKPTDLLFFGKSEQKIMHVGIYIGDNSFIHTSSRENLPYLRISRLSDFEWSGQGSAYYPFRAAYSVCNKIPAFRIPAFYPKSKNLFRTTISVQASLGS